MDSQEINSYSIKFVDIAIVIVLIILIIIIFRKSERFDNSSNINYEMIGKGICMTDHDSLIYPNVIEFNTIPHDECRNNCNENNALKY